MAASLLPRPVACTRRRATTLPGAGLLPPRRATAGAAVAASGLRATAAPLLPWSPLSPWPARGGFLELRREARAARGAGQQQHPGRGGPARRGRAGRGGAERMRPGAAGRSGCGGVAWRGRADAGRGWVRTAATAPAPPRPAVAAWRAGLGARCGCTGPRGTMAEEVGASAGARTVGDDGREEEIQSHWTRAGSRERRMKLNLTARDREPRCGLFLCKITLQIT